MYFPKHWALGKLQLKSSMAFKINVIFSFPALYFHCGEGNRWKHGKSSRACPKFQDREEQHWESSKWSCWKSAIHVSTKGFFWPEWHEPRDAAHPELEETHKDQSTTPTAAQDSLKAGKKNEKQTSFWPGFKPGKFTPGFPYLSSLAEPNLEVTSFSNLMFS